MVKKKGDGEEQDQVCDICGRKQEDYQLIHGIKSKGLNTVWLGKVLQFKRIMTFNKKGEPTGSKLLCSECRFSLKREGKIVDIELKPEDEAEEAEEEQEEEQPEFTPTEVLGLMKQAKKLRKELKK